MIRFAFILLLLSACAPAADCIDDTAFSATVTTVTSDAFKVQLERGGPLRVVTSEETRLVSDSGASLALADLASGTQVYIQGSLTGKDVTAREVRVLNR